MLEIEDGGGNKMPLVEMVISESSIYVDFSLVGVYILFMIVNEYLV